MFSISQPCLMTPLRVVFGCPPKLQSRIIDILMYTGTYDVYWDTYTHTYTHPYTHPYIHIYMCKYICRHRKTYRIYIIYIYI